MEPIENFYYDSGSLYNERAGLKINEIINRLNFLTAEPTRLSSKEWITVSREEMDKTRIEGQIEGLKLAIELVHSSSPKTGVWSDEVYNEINRLKEQLE